MEQERNTSLASSLENFRLPKYSQLPDMGLYLEQTAKYINMTLAPLGFFEITGSMIRNYVKMGLVKNPVQKQYYREHISRLLTLTVLKSVISLDNIHQLFRLQMQSYSDETAFDYFCMELENTVLYRFGLRDSLDNIGVTDSLEKEMLRSAITAVSHIIYLDTCLKRLEDGKPKDQKSQST